MKQAACVSNPQVVPGLLEEEPSVPRVLLGWGTGPLAVALMQIFKKTEKVFPDKSSGEPDYIASPCSGWNIFGRDELLEALQTVVAEDSLETELQKIRVGLQTLGMHFMVEQLGWRRLEKTVKAVDEDMEKTGSTTDDEDMEKIVKAVDIKMEEGLEDIMKQTALLVKTFFSRVFATSKMITWLKRAPHYTKEYCLAIKKRAFQEIIDFAQEMANEFQDKDAITTDEMSQFYEKKGKDLILDFLLHQIRDYEETRLHSLESLLRHASVGRDQSAPFNDIFYFEQNEKEFWTAFKMAEITIIGLFTKFLGRDIAVNLSKSDMPELSTMATKKGVSGYEVKENEPWTKERLITYKRAAEEAIVSERKAPRLDDCCIGGNHSFWSAEKNTLDEDFCEALEVSDGAKIDIKFMQKLTFSVDPTGRMDNNYYVKVCGDFARENVWWQWCRILALVLKHCEKKRKIVIFEMTANTALPHHKNFIDHMQLEHGVDILAYLFQGGSAYANAFHVLEWKAHL